MMPVETMPKLMSSPTLGDGGPLSSEEILPGRLLEEGAGHVVVEVRCLILAMLSSLDGMPLFLPIAPWGQGRSLGVLLFEIMSQ